MFTIDKIGLALILLLFGLLGYAGFLSYQSIDWNVLKKMEAQKLILPTPLPTIIPATPSSN